MPKMIYFYSNSFHLADTSIYFILSGDRNETVCHLSWCSAIFENLQAERSMQKINCLLPFVDRTSSYSISDALVEDSNYETILLRQGGT